MDSFFRYSSTKTSRLCEKCCRLLLNNVEIYWQKMLAKNAVKKCFGEKCCLKKLSKSVKFCRKMLQNLKKIVEFCSFLAKNDVKKSCRKLLSDYIVEKNCCRNLLSHYNSTLFLDGILRQILCRKMRSKKIVEPGQKILLNNV